MRTKSGAKKTGRQGRPVVSPSTDRGEPSPELMSLLHRVDGLMSLIYYREGSALSEQTRRDLDAVMSDVQRITRARVGV